MNENETKIDVLEECDSNKNKESKKENKLGLIVLCMSILICIISISYAIWTQFKPGTKINKLTTAQLDVIFDGEENAINLQDTIPLSDVAGSKITPYIFKVKNSGTIAANYRLSLIGDEDTYASDNCQENRMSTADIKYSFAEIKTTEAAASFNTNILAASDGILKEDVLKSGEVKTFALKLWIKSDATMGNENDPNSGVMGKHFHGKIQVEAIQSDKSFNE